MTDLKIKRLDATDERQYMIHDEYEVYEKHGAPIGALSFHYHNFYEIIYVLEGEYSSMLENQIYHLKKGDFLLIDCNVIHKYHYVEKKHDSSKRIILWISKDMLQQLSDDEIDLSECFKISKYSAYHFPVYYEEQLRGYLRKLVLDELPDITMPNAKGIIDKGYLTLFFAYLNNLCLKKEYLFLEENMAINPLVRSVSTYIEEHIGEPILLEDLAKQVHMSKYYFLRKFKEITGVTVHTFIMHKRLIKASEELREGKPISQVYQASGFTEYSSFLRNFRKMFGIAPGKFNEFY